MTKTRFVPQGFKPYTPDIGDYPKDMFAVYVKMDDPTKLAAIFYVGKQSKHLWYYGFPRIDDMKSKINETISRLMAHEDRKAEQKEARKAPHTLKVGDILYSSWGYDQTNIDFYQVLEVVSGRTVKIRAIASEIVSTPDVSSQRVVAIKDKFLSPRNDHDDMGKILTKRVSATNTVGITSYASAYPWDGNPLYETSTGFGH